ncbi:hypothetical protein GCK32_008992 [Trichostrongylus colubriformis]|uniref:Uncharacterized protein n=1 Tax=Trichostrongylus colubriformis TaxID=6319 RepID=A0AAN8G3H9_TRICO
MIMNLLSCILTVVIIYYLVKRSKTISEADHMEQQNRNIIDKSANRVSLYILLVSALIGVVPGCLNGFSTVIGIPILEEISFFVGTCATLSGLSHSLIFAMAHRDIKYQIQKKILCRKSRSNGGFDGNSMVSTLRPAWSIRPRMSMMNRSLP